MTVKEGEIGIYDGISGIGKNLPPQSTKILGTPFIPPCGDRQTNVQMQISQGTLRQALETHFICLSICLFMFRLIPERI